MDAIEGWMLRKSVYGIDEYTYIYNIYVGRDGIAVRSVTFNHMVAGSYLPQATA